MLPPKIVEIVGKTFGFGISVDEVNTFIASKVWTLNEILLKRTKSLHQMSTYGRKKKCINVNNIEVNQHSEGEQENSG